MSWKCKWGGHDWDRTGHVAWLTDSSGREYAKTVMPMIKVCKRCGKLLGDMYGSMEMTYDNDAMYKLMLDFMADYNSSKQTVREYDV